MTRGNQVVLRRVAVGVIKLHVLQTLVQIQRSRGLLRDLATHPLRSHGVEYLTSNGYLKVNVEEAVCAARGRKRRKVEYTGRVVDLLLDQTRRGNVRPQPHVHRSQRRAEARHIQIHHLGYDLIHTRSVAVVVRAAFLSALEVHRHRRRATDLYRLGGRLIR